jgi:hypothetical protein
MSVQDLFKSYKDQYGLIQPSPNNSSGNSILYTAEYIMALLANNEFDVAERDRLASAMATCQRQSGLLMRSPIGGAFFEDQEGPDDYVGACAASYFMKTDLAARILAHGRNYGAQKYDAALEDPNHLLRSKVLYNLLSLFGLRKINYVWNSNNPGYFTESAWLGRQQNLVCHMQFAAGENPPLWRKLWWMAAIYSGTKATKDNHDAWILAWLCVRTMNGRSWLCNLVANYWKKKMLEMWPGGMGECLCAYFGNPTHPIKTVGLGV